MRLSERAKEYLHVEGRDVGTCDVHEWTADDFKKRLLHEMRARHGKGGLTVCIACIDRAKKAILP